MIDGIAEFMLKNRSALSFQSTINNQQSKVVEQEI